MINIAVVGPIGVGKTTFIQNFAQVLRDNNKSVNIMREPSVSIPFINTALESFYKKGNDWIFPLQIGITAAQEINFQQIRDDQHFDYLLSDMPFSSYIYGKAHLIHNRITEKEFDAMIAPHYTVGPFLFDYVIVLCSSFSENKKRVINRNNTLINYSKDGKLDVAVDNFDYLDEHLKDFYTILNEHLQKNFPLSEVISIELPNITTPEYGEILNTILKKVEVE